MLQIKNGFRDCYYLSESGEVYNKDTKKYLKPSLKHSFKLITKDGERKETSLKTLYKMVFNKVWCIDEIKDLENEYWKEVDGTEGLYWISNFARLKSYHGYDAVLINPYKTNRGYLKADIWVNGQRHCKFIHRIVAENLMEPPKKAFCQLHHIDVNKENNALTNLMWVTEEEHKAIHKKLKNEQEKRNE